MQKSILASFCFVKLSSQHVLFIMADILRKNKVALIRDLRQQGYICDHLVSRRVLTLDNAEEVLCEKTNASKNWVLVDFIRCRFTRAFPHFLDALDLTRQHDLLDVLAPERAQSTERVPAPERQRNEVLGTCSVCLDLPSQTVFSPCGHLSTCRDCGERLTSCPICRAAIVQRVRVYY